MTPGTSPQTDPTPLFDWVRGIHATELLVSAVAHFRVFEKFAERPSTTSELRSRLALESRPFIVLTTALRAMGLLHRTREDSWELTPMAREHLLSDSPFSVSNYIALAAKNPSVLAMVERLRTNRPHGADAPSDIPSSGTAFIFRPTVPSAMEEETSAHALTLSLAGRARNVAPFLAQRLSLSDARLLLDVGCGSGIYSFALLAQNPQLRAVLIDRPHVLTLARQLAHSWNVADRVECHPADMFEFEYPQEADVVLYSNVLHDWDIPDIGRLLTRGFASLRNGGRLVIHDVFLNDTMDGPLPIALYSAALFSLTEGRAYSGAEYRTWLEEFGFEAGSIVPTFAHCGFLVGTKAPRENSRRAVSI